VLDYFGFEITDDELARWDAGTVSLWNELMPSVWQDAAPPGDERFWREDLLLAPGDLKGKSVLELGCGVGRCAMSLICAEACYVGVDVSRVAVQVSRGRYRRWPDVKFLHTIWNAQDISDFGGTFDVAFGTFFFIHQGPERRPALFQGAARLLKPGGLLSVDFWPGEGCAPGPQQFGVNWQHFAVDLPTLEAECGEHGLRLVEVTEARLDGHRQDAIFEKVTA
jgi:SAM-dependent methyltransferase